MFLPLEGATPPADVDAAQSELHLYVIGARKFLAAGTDSGQPLGCLVLLLHWYRSR